VVYAVEEKCRRPGGKKKKRRYLKKKTGTCWGGSPSDFVCYHLGNPRRRSNVGGGKRLISGGAGGTWLVCKKSVEGSRFAGWDETGGNLRPAPSQGGSPRKGARKGMFPLVRVLQRGKWCKNKVSEGTCTRREDGQKETPSRWVPVL